MRQFPIDYIEPVFRPPSEAKSLILQVTNGCSWNKCTFCDMYTQSQKKFRARKDEEIRADILRASQALPGVRRVFLADGDAMVLSTRRLMQILQWLQEAFPALERVGSYCLPRNLARKSIDELTELRSAGLGILYVGAESGDDQVLQCVNKGETFATTVDALQKIKAAGITSSVMILNGLGGVALSAQHARESARLLNETQPDFVATLVVSFPLGEARLRAGFEHWTPLSQRQLFEEVRSLLEQSELHDSEFRSDHASNYLVLKGRLGREKKRLLNELDLAIHQPGTVPLRPEWQRGL